MSDTVRASVRRRLVILWVIALIAALVTGPVLVDSSAFGQSSDTQSVATEAAQPTDEEIAATWTEEVSTSDSPPTEATTSETSQPIAANETDRTGAESWAEYHFEFADGTVITGSNREGESGYTGKKNAADLDLSRNVHVSCSDDFTDGWGDSGAPVEGVDPSPVVSWSIDKYKDGLFHKNCGGGTPPTPPPPPSPPPPVDLPQPDIDVEKLVSVGGAEWLDADAPTGPEALIGEDVRFRFVVTNTGGVTLRDLTLTDSDFDVPVSEVPATLGAGASFAVEIGPFPAVEGQHVDEATVAGQGSATQPHSYTGNRNQYTIVFADGSVFEGSVDQGDVDLGLSQKTHISCSDGFGFNDSDPTNDGWGEKSAPVFGVDPYPIVQLHITRYDNNGGIKRTCGHDDPTAPTTVTDSDPAHYFGRPLLVAVDIEKATNGFDADTGAGPEVPAGSPVTWTYTVTNTGEAPLTNIAVSDNRIGSICTIAELAPGAGETCTATGVAGRGLYENKGAVTADGPSGKPVSDFDYSHYTGTLSCPIDGDYVIDLGDVLLNRDGADMAGPYAAPIPAGTYEVTLVSYDDHANKPGQVQPNEQWFVELRDGSGSLLYTSPAIDDLPDDQNYLTQVVDELATLGADVDTLKTLHARIGTNINSITPICAVFDKTVVPAPSVDLEKFTNGQDADTGPGPYLRAGSDVLWTYTVTNTGNVELTDIVVTDDRIGNVCTIPALDAGNTFTCSATGTAVAGQYENLGTVLAHAPGAKVQANDPSHYFGWQPGVHIEKATNGIDADTVDTAPSVPFGSTVTWTYVVTNTGNVTLADIVVTDDRLAIADITCDADSLAPGSSLTCTATGTAVDQGDGGYYRNVGSVAATPVDDDGKPLAPKPVTDTDPSHYVPLSAALVIEKATNGVDADEPTGPEVVVGDPVRWSYVVSNVGGVALAGVTVTDSDPSVLPVFVGGDSNDNGVLDVGESWTYQATGTATAGQYRNVGTVIGQPVTPGGVPIGDLVEADDPSHYLGIALIHIGDFAWLDLDGDGQQNDGPDSPLAGVTVRLLNAAGEQVATDTTDANGEYTFVVTAGDYSVAFGIPAGHVPTTANQGDDASDSDIGPGGETAQFTVVADDLTIDAGFVKVAPGIDIEKATNGFDADLPEDAPLILVGAPIVWTYVVTNTGNVSLAGIIVDDNRLPAAAVVCPTDTLAPGESFTCEATGVAQPAGDFGVYRNVGTATGTPVDGTGRPIDLPAPNDSDPSHYVGVVGRINIEKATNGLDADTAPGPEVAVGDTVTWTYVVRNDGGVPVADVVVTDSDLAVTPVFVGGDDNNNGLLDLQETWTYEAQGVAVEGQYENLATAAAVPTDFEGTPIGSPITDEDPSHYLGIATQLLRIGDFVWHDFNGDGIQNDGPESPLAGVVVRLLDASGTVLDTTVTDGNGEYGFLVEPGTYRLEFEALAFTVPTLADQGSDDGVDSDIDASGQTGLITVTTDDPTIDAGYYIPAALGDFAWHDFNGNGLQDDGPTSPLAGVGVALLDATGTQVAATTTAADGSYLFEGLAPGAYSVQFAPLDGTVFTAPDAGDDAADSDADPATGITGEYTLRSGDRNLTVDAGFYIPAAIGDFVWEDLDRDGQQGADEPGVAGVSVTLLDGAGVAVDTQTTDEAGRYWFDELIPGVYQVVFTAPSGSVFTTANQGEDATDSDADPATGAAPPVTLASGDQNRTVDAGLIFPSASLNFVKLVNGEDANVPTGPYVAAGSPVVFIFRVTNTGDTAFADVTVGDSFFGTVCTVDVLLPGQTGQCSVTTTATAGQHQNLATVVATPVDDEGVPVGDPVLLDDPGHYFGVIAGIDIEKATNGVDADIMADAPVIIAGETVTWTYVVTNTGNVSLSGITVDDNLLPADAVVCPADTLAPGESFECEATGVAQPAGDFGGYRNVGTATGTPVDDTGAAIDVPAPSDDDPSHYIGVISRINVEKATNGFDADVAPGPEIEPGAPVTWTYTLRNDGEVPLAGVTVTDSDPDVNPVFVGGDDNGNGLFDSQESWVFQATGTAQPGQYQNLATATGVPADSDGNPIGGPVSDDDPSHYNGTTSLLQIGDFVWHDFNGDGFQNDGPSSPLAGVEVQLLDLVGTVLATTTTDALGAYGFVVPIGTYQLQFIALPGTVPTGANLGGNDAADSDINAAGRITLFTVTADNFTLDAGYYIPASLGDFVWNDLDRDGIQDPGEPGIEGVAVTLLDASGAIVASTITDGNGAYEFTDLAPGDYTLQFETPDGFFFSPPNQGGDDTVDSDPDPFDGTVSVGLQSGDSNNTIDAGFSRQAFLGDFVWEDLDGNGIQDGGEPGIAGVTVRLFDGTGTVNLQTVLTDSAGAYRFGPLAAGDYIVEFAAPDGFFPTVLDAGSDDTVDSDADPETGRTTATTLTAGEDDPTWDAGFVQPARIGDFVWNDLNADGIQDAGEPGVSGVAVTAVAADGTIVTTVTDANGAWSLTVPPGSTEVSFTAPDGFAFTDQDAGSDDAADSDPNPAGLVIVDVVSGQDDLTIDAGLVAGATIGDFVWDDRNGNGVQDTGEPGLSGITVLLLAEDGTEIASTSTDADGAYSFGVLPGTYVIQFDLPEGAVFTTPNVGSDATDSDADPATGRSGPVTVVSGESNLTIDAGVLLPAVIGDQVWEDLNANGVNNSTIEMGVAGITVELLDAAGSVIDTTVTDIGGLYDFTVVPGTYSVRFVIPDDWTITTPNATGDTRDSDADPATGETPQVTVGSGESNFTIDAGIWQPAIIGDFVWEDLDRDGVQDPDEPGVPGVTVRLRSGGQELDSTVTDADGFYGFIVDPGRYRVVFEPVGYVITTPNATDDTLDSDPDPANGRTTDFGIFSREVDDTWDAGVYKLIDLQIDKQAVPDNIATTLNFEYIVTVTNLGPSDASEVVVLDLLPSRSVADPPYSGAFAAFPCFSDWDVTAGDAQNCVGDEAFQVDTPQFGTEEPPLHPSERGDEEIAPGVIAPQSVTLNGTTAPAGVDCAYNAAVNGVRCDIGDLAVGSSIDIVFDVTSNPLNRVRVWNRAWVYGAEYETNLDNTDPGELCASDAGDAFGDRGTGCNYVKKNEELDPQADLSLVKSVSADTAVAGDELVYTIEASNAGPWAAAAAVIVDTLPAGVTATGIDEGCAYDASANTVECPVGLMMPGDTVTRSITVVVADNAVGPLVNTATIENREDPESGPDDPDLTNNTDIGSTDLPLSVVIDLEVEKTAAPAAIDVGDETTFVLTVTNVGPDDATGVVLTDAMPGAFTVLLATGDGTYDATTGRWAVGDLAAGASASLSVVVEATEAGAFTNTVEVTAAAEPDVDSTPGDGTGDDYAEATVAVTEVLPQTVTTTTAAPDTLPRTGLETGTLAGLGGALLALGLAALAAARRRDDAV